MCTPVHSQMSECTSHAYLLFLSKISLLIQCSKIAQPSMGSIFYTTILRSHTGNLAILVVLIHKRITRFIARKSMAD